MTRGRYLLLWVIVSFILLFFASWAIESVTLQSEATQVQSLTTLSADSALQAGQGIDDFFATPENYITQNESALKKWGSTLPNSSREMRIKFPQSKGSSSYTEQSLFDWYDWDLHVIGADKREVAFSSLYDGTGEGTYDGCNRTPTQDAIEFMNFAKQKAILKSITQIPYTRGTNVMWVAVPRVALVGARCIWESEVDYKHSVATVLYTLKQEGVLKAAEYGSSVNWGWEALEQNGYLYGRKEGVFGTYYLTPSKVGVTYINRNLIEKIYQNNIDNIMRYSYSAKGTLDDHWGIFSGNYVIQDHNVENNINSIGIHDDIINNGIFSVDKDTSLIEQIDYQVIDIYDTSEHTKEMVEAIYGGYVEYNDDTLRSIRDIGIMTPTKLKSRSTARKVTMIDGIMTSQPWQKNYMVVAKVTFSTDVILTHKTAVFSTWCTDPDIYTVNRTQTGNYNDIKQTRGRESDGKHKYTYVTIYAVTA